MKRISNLSLLLLLAGLILSGKQLKPYTGTAGEKHTIEGNIAGLGHDTILVKYMPVANLGIQELPMQDTLFSIDGKFYLDLRIKEPVLLYLFPKKGELARLDGTLFRPATNYLVMLVTPSNKLTIKGKLKDYYLDYQVSGSEFNEQYGQVRKKYIQTISEAVSLELGLDTLLAINGNGEVIQQLFTTRSEINGFLWHVQLEFIRNNLDQELAAFFLMNQPNDVFFNYYAALTADVRNGLFKKALARQYKTLQNAHAKAGMVPPGGDMTLCLLNNSTLGADGSQTKTYYFNCRSSSGIIEEPVPTLPESYCTTMGSAPTPDDAVPDFVVDVSLKMYRFMIATFQNTF
ncbi:DUF4369 domain-containing protein [Pontibacter qinzhouensis]|uniref:DUF4369 domain-containing protein n=1 Tax=Pontibacter qinzhouensis TaxID=2603253 RepID=A0A5C8K4W6_9BACT|nr:DUF4369 domain-containing protein [Pontibacter qinzhouensis]TXK44915.1 DUF4369 domain-containing protein [Pontibacter qinzhouensis]